MPAWEANSLSGRLIPVTKWPGCAYPLLKRARNRPAKREKLKGTMMKRLLLLPAALLCVLTAGAAPLKRADVKADPALVVHVDFDAFRATSVGKAFLAQLSQPDIDEKLTAIQGMFDFDPRTQLHGATVYAMSVNPPEGVLIVYADFDSNRVVALGKLAPGFAVITNGSRRLYTWIDQKAKTNSDGSDGNHIYAAIRGNRLILSKGQSPLTTALDVLDGSAPSLSGDKAMTELGAAADGNVIQAVVRKFDFGGEDPNAAIFKMSKIVRFQVGEKADHIAATLSFQAKDEDVATQISAIAQGLLALLKLQQGDPGILKIAKAVSLHQDGATVTASASVLSQDVVDLIKSKVTQAEEEHSGDTNTAQAKK